MAARGAPRRPNHLLAEPGLSIPGLDAAFDLRKERGVRTMYEPMAKNSISERVTFTGTPNRAETWEPWESVGSIRAATGHAASARMVLPALNAESQLDRRRPRLTLHSYR